MRSSIRKPDTRRPRSTFCGKKSNTPNGDSVNGNAIKDEKIPAGWKIVRNTNTNPTGSIWINNGSRFTGDYQHKLIKDPREKENRE